jgi:hypothetical protein
MEKGSLTREEAIAKVGESAVVAVEKENSQPTNRVGYNGVSMNDDECEFASSVIAEDADGDEVTLVAYYYISNEDEQIMVDNDGDGSYINWTIAGYEVI